MAFAFFRLLRNEKKYVGKFYVTAESLKRSASYHPFVIIRPSIRLLYAPTLRNTLNRVGVFI
jgi:hypothetical protein